MHLRTPHGRLLPFFLLFLLLLTGCGRKLTGAFPAPPPYEKLVAAHKYTPLTKGVAVEATVADTELFVQHITFPNKKKQTVTAIFVCPKADGVYPVVLILHGLESNKEQSVFGFGRTLAAQGVASLSLDAPLHGERAPKKGTGLVDKDGNLDGMVFAGVMEQGVAEQRQALDYLTERKDIDPRRIGLMGYSLGAMMGTVTAAIDKRVVAVALCAGGDPIRYALYDVPSNYWGRVERISPSNYIPYIEPRPVYLVNGTNDETIGDRSVKLLVDAAGATKTVVSLPGAGHNLSQAERDKASVWLANQLKSSGNP